MFALLVLFAAVQLSAQDISFAKPEKLNRFYADVLTKTANLNSYWALFGGMRAGYNINENVSIGLAAHGLVPNYIDGSYIVRKGSNELHLGYGGVEAAYKLNLSDRFYAAGIVMVGAGRANVEKLGGNDYFFIMEPGASINYRVTDWFGLGYSVSYRYASGVKYADYSNASFSGWSMDLGFKFGFDL